MFRFHELILIVSSLFFLEIICSNYYIQTPKFSSIDILNDFKDYLKRSEDVAYDNCKIQMRWNQWNCPQQEFLRRNSYPSTKENGFSHAIFGSTLVYHIALDCLRGVLKNCSCSLKKLPSGSEEITNEFINYLDFAEYTSEKLFEISDETKFNEIAKIHNRKIGMKAVRKSMKKICRCHGVTGSCTSKICWWQIGKLPEITTDIHYRYKKSIKFKPNRPMQRNRKNALIFTVDSPNYCVINKTTGWPGMIGRECSRKKTNVTIEEKKSCKRLCTKCNLKVKRQFITTQVKCNCKFEWCCSVSCQVCLNSDYKFFCEASNQVI